MAVKTFNIPILYSMDTRRFDTPMRDCLRDIGVYFGDYYWFMSGYTPVSSRNAIASAKINCIPTEACPGGERHDIDVGETARFNYGFDVRVNSLIPGYPDAYANITVTEVDIVPDMNISSILLDKTSVTIGDEVIFEACMTNNGGRGDIELYTGFAYQDFINGPPLYLNGYVRQTIGDVLVGEYLCPYGIISVTQEVIDAKESGKDVKFWASAIPGNSLSKSINIEIPQEPIFCTQQFRVEDQDRNPLISVISSPTWDIDLQVPSTGEASLYMEQGITHTVTAYNYEHNLQQTRTLTACTSQPLIFVLDIPDPCEGVICENVCTDEGHLVIRECDPFLGICQSVRTELNSPECVQPETGKIGEIAHTISESIGEDEISFEIPVTNISSGEKYFYVDLRDENGNFVEKAPILCKNILAGKTEIVHMSSVGAAFPIWSFETVRGQTVTFELVLSTGIGTKVRVVDTVTYVIEEEYIPPETGKIGEIVHTVSESIGEDEISFEIPVTNISSKARYFYVDLRDENGNFIEKSPILCENIPAGETEIVHMSSIGAAFPTWSFENVRGQTVTFELVLSTSIGTKIEVTDTITHVVEEEYVPPETGKIGGITYDIIKQILNDEIVFYIPVTNLSDKERCFYVDLYDESGNFVDKAPNTLTPIGKFANRIAAGATETIEMSSNWELWHIGHVQGQIVTFKLRSDEMIPVVNYCSELHTTYDIADEVTVDLNNIDIAINTRIDNTEGLITKNMEVGLLYVDPTTITKTDICNSPVNITGVLNTEIVTGWLYPGPFTCSGKAYPADSMFIAYVKGYDDEDNEYYEISSIFRSVYGIKEVSLKVTGDSLVDENGCYIDHPFDPTKCLLTDKQANFLMWGGIAVTFIYALSVVKPIIKGAGEGLQALTKK